MTEQEKTGNSTELCEIRESEIIFGNYIKKGRIGSGGFGEVYRAQHRILKNDVVIKILRPDRKNESLIGSLVREGQVLTRLNHENIVRVLDLNVDADDQIYLIMDYIDGGDLATHLQRAGGLLPFEEVARIINQIAKGLNYVHQLNIIHRDLKPQNILLDKTGKIVLADFGLAKFVDSMCGEASQSSIFGRAGTPHYMAPEHSEGKAEKRSDLYSLGIITYQLLTGRLPFNGTSIQIQTAHRLKEPPSLRELNPKITPEIELVVLKMLEKSPDRRYQSALDFARDLQHKIYQKTIKALRTDPERIDDDLANIGENGVLRLGPGNYQGPFTLSKRLHLIGAGEETKLYTVDEAVLCIQVAGTQLENMLIERTRESADEAVIRADGQVSYVLKQVTIRGGLVEGAIWEDAEWQLPSEGIDLGKLPVEGPQTRTVQIEVKEQCTLTVQSNLPGLKVFPVRLLPGPHTLTLEFNAGGNLPGTQLDAKVFLQGESESKEIHVTGQLEQPAMKKVESAAQAAEKALTAMEWAYQLWDEAARRLLSELGDAEEKDLAARWRTERGDQRLKRQMLDRAADLLFELVGRQACLWYVRRLRVNEREQYRDEEIWELTLAIDGPHVPARLSASKKTLCLECRVMRDGRGTLKISKAFIIGQDKGVKSLATLPALVRLLTRPDASYRGIPTAFIKQLQELPIKSADELDVDQLRGWQNLLEFQSAQIRKRQYWVGYIRHTYREGTAKVTFFLDQASARNDKQESISYGELQSLVNKSKREHLKIFSTLPPPGKVKKWRDKDTIGVVERFHPDDGRLEIRLEPKMAARLRNGTYVLPQEGYLHFDASGEMLQKERHQEALTILQQGRAENPSLGDFFFDARKARAITGIQQLQPIDLLSGTCNPGQISAIEAALATRDLLLIQGPPGTGKTTVIAEICYQVALHGGRTLIASQSNLAVDNALSRIIHHPRVRALRKGNPDTVEEEGRDYTEEYVVQKWLHNTALDCQNRLAKRRKNMARFQRLLASAERFSAYKELEVQWANTRMSLQQRQANALRKIPELVTSLAQNAEAEQKYAPVQHMLSALLAGEILRDTSIKRNNALQYGFITIFSDITSRRNFMSQVNEGLEIIKQIGRTPPGGDHLLMCSVWLKEMVHRCNQNWRKSQELIDLIEKQLLDLAELQQLQENAEQSLAIKQKKIQEISLQITKDQTNLQYLIKQKERFQQALTVLTAYGANRIEANLERFHSAKLGLQAPPSQQAWLSVDTIFPSPIATLLHENSRSSFEKLWTSVEQDIQQSIAWTAREREQYRQICQRLEACKTRFAFELAFAESIKQYMSYLPVERYMKTPTDSAAFDWYISRVEANLGQIEEARTRPARIWTILLKEQQRQRMWKLFLETRELLNVSQEMRNNIPRSIHEANAALFTRKANELFQGLQQWLNERLAESSNHSTAVSRKKERLETEKEQLQRQCQQTEVELKNARNTIEVTGQRLSGLFRELSNCPDIPVALSQQAQRQVSVSTAPFLPREDYRQVARQWMNDIQRLEMLVNAFWNELQNAEKAIHQQLAQVSENLVQQRAWLRRLEDERDTCAAQLRTDPPELVAERQWWHSFWETIPDDLRPLTPAEGILAPSLLEAMEKQFSAWEKEFASEERQAQRSEQLVEDWIDHLRHLTEDETRELQEIYMQNANVIGITCGQAYKLSLRDWRTFDTVIIDEVSKATAPELLLPAIKGQKLILIGDQHQLPPMIEDKTLDQMAEEFGQDSQAYRFLNRSYFLKSVIARRQRISNGCSLCNIVCIPILWPRLISFTSIRWNVASTSRISNAITSWSPRWCAKANT